MMKPGVQTTEFWGTLFVHLMTLVITLATVFGKSLNVSGLNALFPSLSIVASGIAQGFYSHGRSLVKLTNMPVAVQPVPTGLATIPLPGFPPNQ